MWKNTQSITINLHLKTLFGVAVVILAKHLAERQVGPEIRKLKLEHSITHAAFLTPKIYGIRTTD